MKLKLQWCLPALLCAGITLNAFIADKPNQLTDLEKKEGWKLLFDGKTTNGWHLYNKGKIPSAWVVQNGELYCKPEFNNTVHGDLVSDKEFENYDLKFEWKISKEGNSGVFINVQEKKELPTAWASGPEYQLLEKSHPDYTANEIKKPGCLFNLYPQKNPATIKNVGQWNQSRIVQKNGKVQFYLNGSLTAEEDMTAAKWKKRIADSNFKTFPEFGKHTKGHLALQDWAKGISFRNVKIREL
jgi:hypothetical protein